MFVINYDCLVIKESLGSGVGTCDRVPFWFWTCTVRSHDEVSNVFWSSKTWHPVFLVDV